MSNYKASSWGRTRQLKNIAGPHGTEVDVVAVGTLDAVTDGYSTESQRFLHVLVIDKNAGANLSVTLYGYSHAFGKWFPLKTHGVTGAVSGTAVVVTVGNTSTAEGSQTAAQREMVTVEISGIDRVAFVGTTADVRVYAACSTF
tara:strand:+ start:1345 stop:1776 length:432 start_codon:yes stop_codon:yes gene_type:complete